MVNSMPTAQKTHAEESFERFLAQSLKTVEPDPVFVGHLRQRLIKKPEIQIEKSSWMAAYLVVAAGIFSGALLFWMLARVFRGVRLFLWKNETPAR